MSAHFAHVVNAQNISVGDFAGENHFLLEALQRIGLAHHAFAHHFDGHHAVEILVVGLVHPAHAALAEHRFDAISRAEIAAGSDDGRIYDLDGVGIHAGHGRAAA